ncbi:very-long-chain enoyl-CoA reductase-like [Sinocyclocheilus anshuiensis]|uniref:very-long-chain enoyl-CoA reductase-like n=1 Tax=Sinocyclocheilus anshuiensis TaxID=1608454 RepID=UPI0007B85F72|nr:PREDICTED: very-long-chain enoyl-CoA reductase-like [Sinocyclocheilus anshuiensis]
MSLIFQVFVFFIFFILDSKTKEQLCFLDKVEPHSSVGDIKGVFHKSYPKWYPARQALRLDPKGKALRDDDVLQNLSVGTSATLYFRDLGPQLGWTMNCAYYWGFAAWLAYYINHPLYTPPSETQVNYALIIFALCEAGIFSIHWSLNSLKCEGAKCRRFPHLSKNPFTWLFYFVSCPNYTYEVTAPLP